MKTLKVKSIALGLVATFMLVIIIQSCTQQELPIPTEKPDIEATTIELTQDNPIVIALKASEDIKHYNTEAGELLWDMVTMTTYNHEENLPVIIVPINNETESKTLSMLIAAYSVEDNSFLSVINSYEMDLDADATLGYTGKVVYKTLKNVVAKSVSYVSGEVTEEQFNVETLENRNWNCFVNCLSHNPPPSHCSGSYYKCRNWISYRNPWCHTLAGCIAIGIGTTLRCAVQCW